MPHQTKRVWCKKHKKMVTGYRDFSFWWATCGCDNEVKRGMEYMNPLPVKEVSR